MNKLQGRWVGRPDTAAKRAKREGEKYGDKLSDAPFKSDATAKDEDESGSAAKLRQAEQVTDWEKYPIQIHMNFADAERLEMSLDDQQQPRSGRWKVISTSPTGCTIEIETEEAAIEGDDTVTVMRRFDLLLDEREGNCVGFLMTESGADRLQGAIYFQRPSSSGTRATTQEH